MIKTGDGYDIVSDGMWGTADDFNLKARCAWFTILMDDEITRARKAQNNSTAALRCFSFYKIKRKVLSSNKSDRNEKTLFSR
mmetsp:Transcript_12936/g.19779  ORF Transcript_12936/g.19779 Transcript_12936/m.19779 type:complete len:82 (-) Transcript_12936:959-1204(-)